MKRNPFGIETKTGRALSPLTNGVGYTALAGLLLAVAQAAYNAHNSGQPVTWQVIATAAVGVLAGWARGKVTPVKDPRDGNGQPLIPSQAELQVTTVTGSTQADFTQQIADEVYRLLKPGMPVWSYSTSPVPPGHGQGYAPAARPPEAAAPAVPPDGPGPPPAAPPAATEPAP